MIGVWLAAVGTFAGAPSSGDGPRASFDYEVIGADACPSRTALEEQVAAHLGYRPFTEGASLSLSARVRALSDRLTAHLEAEENGVARGKRDLESRAFDCRELAAALALAIAISIDPMSALRPPPDAAAANVAGPPPEPSLPAAPPGAAPHETEGPRPVPLPPPVAAPAGDPDASRFRLRLAVGALATLGAAPEPTGAGVFEVVAAWPRVSIGLGARADVPTYGAAAQGSLSAAIAVATLAPCLHLRWFSGCGVLNVGALWGAGHALAAARGFSVPYVAAGGRLAAEVFSVDRFALLARLEVLGTVLGATLIVGATPRWQTPDVSGTAGLALLVDVI